MWQYFEFAVRTAFFEFLRVSGSDNVICNDRTVFFFVEAISFNIGGEFVLGDDL